MKNLPIILRRSLSNFDEFYEIEREMDKIFGGLVRNFKSPTIRELEGNYPKMNILKKDENIEIIAATPGLQKENLQVKYKDGLLSIVGETIQDKKDEGCEYLCREIKKSSFCRAIQLDDSALDVENIESSYKNGELRISIPKKEEILKKQETKKIKIK